MATEDKRIDQLPVVGTLSPEALLVLQKDGEALKMTAQQLLDYIQNNIYIGNAVLFVAQDLTEAQKYQARANIGAAAPGEGGSGGAVTAAVLYTYQALTEEQQRQARLNIRCGSVGDVYEESKASGPYSHAEGFHTKASGSYSHAEGYYTKASNGSSHAEGHGTETEGGASHAEGYSTKAGGSAAHAEGQYTAAWGGSSHAEGYSTTALGRSSHVEGEYNIPDPEADDYTKRGKYVHIVGNGTADDARSNAHTLDWEGNAWYAGSVEGTAMILKSPGGKRFSITVNDSGSLTAEEIV